MDSLPAAADDRVYIGSGDTGVPLSASPAIADGKVVIRSQDGVLYCFG